MENPFLRLKNDLGTSKFFALCFMSLTFFTGVLLGFTGNTTAVSEDYQPMMIVDSTSQSTEIHDNKKVILHKETPLRSVIKDKIVENGINEKVADKYAKVIIIESKKRGHSPLLQTALLQSESSFKVDPNHGLKGVVGMGGIYWDVWKKELIKEKIAFCKNDLKNPETNIKASAFILSKYMEQCKERPRDALTHYKGYSKLGRKQANNVMNIAINLRKKANNA